MALRYLPVRYEDIVADQEVQHPPHARFHRRGVRRELPQFHENRRYARTASYAQVTEKLYDRSRFRYRRYAEALAPIVPILQTGDGPAGLRLRREGGGVSDIAANRWAAIRRRA